MERGDTIAATLNSHIRYKDGYIEVLESLVESFEVDDAELVESGCVGWGDSNAVVLHGGSYYLATISG